MHLSPRIVRALFLTLFTLWFTPKVNATPTASVVVNTTSDAVDPNDGVLSLREAITAANQSGTPAIITFDPVVFAPGNGSQVIQLTGSLPDLAQDITITGPGANLLTVNGQVFFTPGARIVYRLLRIQAGCHVAISGLTLSNGGVDGVEGATGRSDGTLPAPGGNSAGGAIYNSGDLTLTLCTFSGNGVEGGPGGFGGANLAQDGARGGDGLGGAIYSEGALTVDRCTFEENFAFGGRGGFGSNAGTAGTATGNGGPGADSKGGAVYVAGTGASFRSCTIARNEAGAGDGGFGGTSSVTNTLGVYGAPGNSAGGAFYVTGTLTLTSCTVAQNFASPAYSYQSGPIGGGIYAEAQSVVMLANTLLASNVTHGTNQNGQTTSQVSDVFGPLTSQGFNLIGAADLSNLASPLATDQVGTVASPIDPRLDPAGPADNGGPVPTLRLRRGSPAVDRGRDVAGLGIDEAGNPRPLNLPDSLYPDAAGSDGSDIGAYEAQSLPDDAPHGNQQTLFGVKGLPFNNPALMAYDADGDALTFSVAAGSTLPPGLTLLPSGKLTGTPSAAGTFTFQFQASDGQDLSKPVTATVTIAASARTVVNSIGDSYQSPSGLTCLREAVSFAAVYGVPLITFDPQVFATHQTCIVNFNMGPIYIDSNLEIDGPAAGVTLSGAQHGGVFSIYDGTAQGAAPLQVVLKNLEIKGRLSTTGGGIMVQAQVNQPRLNLIGCTLDNNAATANGGAIAIYAGQVTLVNCTLANNHAGQTPGSNTRGGAIWAYGGSVTLYNCTVAANSASGLVVS